jgi:hypothetical protein
MENPSQTDILPNPSACPSACSCVKISADNQYGHTFVCNAADHGPC